MWWCSLLPLRDMHLHCVPIVALLGIFRNHQGNAFIVYGDSIYASKICAFLHAPFTGVFIAEAHQRFNKLMAAFRISVEWGLVVIDSCLSLCRLLPMERLASTGSAHHLTSFMFVCCCTTQYREVEGHMPLDEVVVQASSVQNCAWSSPCCVCHSHQRSYHPLRLPNVPVSRW